MLGRLQHPELHDPVHRLLRGPAVPGLRARKQSRLTTCVHTYVSFYLSLSLSIYIYIYVIIVLVVLYIPI